MKNKIFKIAKNKKFVILLVIIILLILLFLFTVFIPKQQINKAKTLIQNEEYDTAYQILEKNYSKFDAANILNSSKYERATEFFNNKNYEKSIELLTGIETYKNSLELINESNYQLASRYLENKNNTMAAWYFMQSFDYKDSKELYCSLINDRCLDDNGSSIFLKKDGTVVVNTILPENNKEITDEYNKQTESWRNVKSVSSGSYFVLGLKNDGTVYSAGRNNAGQCDTETWKNIIQLSANEHSALGLTDNGTVIATGNNEFDQCNVENWTNIVSVSMGDNHSVGLTRNGTVMATGNNDNSQCDTYDWEEIVAVDTGYELTVGLKKDGTVISTNEEFNDALSTWNDIVQVSTDGFYILGLKSDGSVVSTGNNKNHQCDVEYFRNVTEICAAGFHSYAICSSGEVLGCGGAHIIDYGSYKNIKVNEYRIQSEFPTSMFVGTWYCKKENSCNNMNILLVIEQKGNTLYYSRKMGNDNDSGGSNISYTSSIPSQRKIEVDYIKGSYEIIDDKLVESFSNGKSNRYIKR